LDSLAEYVRAEELAMPRERPVALRESLNAWIRRLATFWNAEGSVRRLLHRPAEHAVSQLVSAVKDAIAISDMAAVLRMERQELLNHFGHFFSGFDTDWESVIEALGWTQRVRNLFGSAWPPARFIGHVSGLETVDHQSKAEWSKLKPMLDDLWRGLDYVVALFEPGSLLLDKHTLEEASINDLMGWLDERVHSVGRLEEWIDCKHTRDECVSGGLEGYLEDLDRFRPGIDLWRDAFVRRFYNLWLDDRYTTDPVLANFRGDNHQRCIREFRELDRQALVSAPHWVRHSVLSRRPQINAASARAGEPAILYHEMQKRRRHKPIRRLFREIPNLLLTLKPCLLMSPLSVSQYLDAARIQFDLVVFDEASQVLPEDAVGSIVRGRQIVVAGDQQQLPPTDFFRAHFQDDVEEDESEDDEILESILDQFASL
jgi:hypothetical protein